MNYAVKRKRPRKCSGWTRKFILGGSADNLYITLNIDKDGELFEVFIRQGRAGTEENCSCEAIARLVSLALRCKADPRDIAKQLRGISGPSPIWEAPAIEGQRAILLLSTPHCVAVAINEWLENTYKPKPPREEPEIKEYFPNIIPHFKRKNT